MQGWMNVRESYSQGTLQLSETWLPYRKAVFRPSFLPCGMRSSFFHEKSERIIGLGGRKSLPLLMKGGVEIAELLLYLPEVADSG